LFFTTWSTAALDQDIADLHQDIEELRPGKRGEGNSGKRPAFGRRRLQPPPWRQ